MHIIAGQRDHEYLSDHVVYDLERRCIVDLARDSAQVSGPGAGFTQRATLDARRGEINVLSGLVRNSASTGASSASSTDLIENSLWIYNIGRNRWRRVGVDGGASKPVARFAHQIVIDACHSQYYLFGGNSGSASDGRRLDDMWRLTVPRHDAAWFKRRALFHLRQLELRRRVAAAEAPLDYLHDQLQPLISQSDPELQAELHQLSLDTIFSNSNSNGNYDANDALLERQQRLQCFDNIVKLLPRSVRDKHSTNCINNAINNIDASR